MFIVDYILEGEYINIFQGYLTYLSSIMGTSTTVTPSSSDEGTVSAVLVVFLALPRDLDLYN